MENFISSHTSPVLPPALSLPLLLLCVPDTLRCFEDFEDDDDDDEGLPAARDRQHNSSDSEENDGKGSERRRRRNRKVGLT
uniref:Putative secreted protein n=1 Tax=Anopheles marajoara TaxID=58244 RepID=A0A2M4CBM0_9DIPT